MSKLPSNSTAGKTVMAVEEIEKAPEAGLPIALSFKYATIILFSWQILMILLLGTCGKDNFFDEGADFNGFYQYFTGVEIMMFIGFGYLMTFLKRYGMGAVGLTMLITVVALQWGIWIEVRACTLKNKIMFYLKLELFLNSEHAAYSNRLLISPFTVVLRDVV